MARKPRNWQEMDTAIEREVKRIRRIKNSFSSPRSNRGVFNLISGEQKAGSRE